MPAPPVVGGHHAPNLFAPNLARADHTPGLKGTTNGARFADVGAGWSAFTHTLARTLPTSLLRAGQYQHAARQNIARAGRRR